MARQYDHKRIEQKWKKLWKQERVYKTEFKKARKKIYVLDMFPYPSGEGLHVGHPRGYVGSDILARYYRLKGYQVLHPMGFDAFGLPAENAAIKKGIHPRENTKTNIERFKKQLEMFSLSYDWSREINTSDPQYYRWTQWLFLLLYKNGLAYRKRAKVNFCPKDKTVLANEQITEGRCERCGSQVVQKELAQWFFRITEFAEELLDGLEDLDWPESTKELQRNWIGRSEGFEILFPVANHKEKITVFTTRADTLYGASYLVLAPEHPLVEKVIPTSHRKPVTAYLKATQLKTELERQADVKEKTGVFSGAYALNPATGQEIPIFIADYVLPHYGTGAIMAVPAHDERDFAFAKKFRLPIIRVIEGGELPYAGEGPLINSGEFNNQLSSQAAPLIAKKVGGKSKIHYRLRDWLISRQRYWGAPIPIVYKRDGEVVPLSEDELPVILPDDVDFRPTGLSPLARSKKFNQGIEKKYGKGAKRETDTMDTFVDSSWYFLRYADPWNDRAFVSKEALKKWLPVDLYIGGAEHASGHLIFARFLTKVLYRLGYLNFNEPFLKLRHQGLILGPDGFKMSKSRGNVVNPDELIGKFGADAFRMYEMFIGPFRESIAWDVRGIEGVSRFLSRVWQSSLKPAIRSSGKEPEKALHRLIQKVTSDIEEFKFNTTISSFMEFFNHFGGKLSKRQWERFLILLFPFVPHLSSEIWRNLKLKGRIDRTPWPTFDQEMTRREIVKLPVQVNGRLKGLIEISPDASQKEVMQKIGEDKRLRGYALRAKQVVYRESRVINLVV